MTKFELLMALLGAIGLIGIFVLIGFDKNITVIMPVVTSIIGWLIGKKQIVEKAGYVLTGKKYK